MFRKNLLVFSLAIIFLMALSACARQTADTSTAAIDTPPPVETPVEDVTESTVGESDVDARDMAMPVLEDIFFTFDKHDLSSGAKSRLADNARQLKDSDMTITIEGHCDERGTNSYNLALGERRANVARDYLRSLGIPRSRIKTVSYGEERPFERGATENAWAKNRRAHFVVSRG